MIADMTNSTPKRILTGLQPSGQLHIGNYFGALLPFQNTIKEHPDSEFFLMVADYHSLTSLKDAQALQDNIYNVVRTYLALGIDPNQVTLFRQSDNQDHTELAWILNCQVTVPFLMQAHSYKDKVAKGLDANAGLFTYPMLMAADIVLYDTDLVPVGEDQRQHLEYTREAVAKFNKSYGEYLKAPKELILKDVGVIPGLDGQKMSKSYGNTIPLFASAKETEKAVMKIVTDSEGSFPEHVYAIHKLFRSEADLKPLYEEHKGQYGTLKQQLAADINSSLAPIRESYNTISDEAIRATLEAGAARARYVSNPKLRTIRTAVGISL